MRNTNATFFDKYGDRFSCSNKEEFIERYWGITCFGQEDKSKSENDTDECWAISTYLIIAQAQGFLGYPFEVVKGESPDFSIKMGDEITGIEVVTLTTNLYQAATNIAKKSGKEYTIELSDFKNQRSKKFPATEITRVLKESGQDLSGSGFQGDEPYVEAKNLLAETLIAKLLLLNSDTYTIFPKMEIIIRNDSHLMLGSRLDRVAPYFKSAISAIKSSGLFKKQFNKVHFLSGEKIVYDLENDVRVFSRDYEPGVDPKI